MSKIIQKIDWYFVLIIILFASIGAVGAQSCATAEKRTYRIDECEVYIDEAIEATKKSIKCLEESHTILKVEEPRL